MLAWRPTEEFIEWVLAIVGMPLLLLQAADVGVIGTARCYHLREVTLGGAGEDGQWRCALYRLRQAECELIMSVVHLLPIGKALRLDDVMYRPGSS